MSKDHFLIFDESPSVSASATNRLLARTVNHLIGICDGIAADDVIIDKEVLFLRTWLNEHREVTQVWPGSMIADRIDAILADGIITVEERADLLATLRKLSGNQFDTTGSATPDAPSVPIDDDPSIYFKNMSYCFTGQFLYGTRAACERAILGLGGTAVDNITKRLDYLVVGSMIEPLWANTTYGRKIEKAMDYKQKGAELAIVSERQWTDALKDAFRS